MLPDPDGLIAELTASVPAFADMEISHEAQPAPHTPHSLPLGKCAVYVFSLSGYHGEASPAGPDKVLKVGRVGANSNARFQSQHYNPASARSTLAASLLRNQALWSFLGIEELSPTSVGGWIRANTDRDNFYMPARHAASLPDLERFVRGRLGSVFEGG